MKRYGKASAGILGVKQNFFATNDLSLATAQLHAALYVAQPRRERCKLCATALPGQPDFTKLGIPYALCRCCNQLNGLHDDTDAFCRAVYFDEIYGDYYGSADRAGYDFRVEQIYRPKVEFLADALRADGWQPDALRYADIGAGSGHFVAALVGAGFERCVGLEISPQQTAYANRMIGGERIRQIEMAETVAVARTLDADIVSMIGVLEHVQEPRAVLAALRDNPAPRYIFLCLPLFGLCVFLEMVFPQVYPRHLVSDHTHLFTPRSIAWMEEAFALERRAEWWFGSDMIDLYRHVGVALAKNADTSAMEEHWQRMMPPLVDPMQLAIDRQHAASEVHLLLKIRR
jgi:methyltransferase family protein